MQSNPGALTGIVLVLPIRHVDGNLRMMFGEIRAEMVFEKPVSDARQPEQSTAVQIPRRPLPCTCAVPPSWYSKRP